MKTSFCLMLSVMLMSPFVLAGDWDLTILHTNSLNGALDNCG